MAQEREKIRIAVMTHTIDGRKAKGTAVVARKNVEALLACRDEFDITFVHYEKWDDPIYTHGVREVILPNFWPGFINRRILRQTWYHLFTKDRFDIFHWFQPRMYPLFWYAKAKHLVVSVHGVDTMNAERFNFMQSVFYLTLQLFQHTISAALAASEYARGEIIQFYGFPPERVHSVPNAADETFVPATKEAVERVRKTYALPEKFFLNVARLNPGKNALRVIKAFARYAKEHPESDIHFVNIGAGGFDKHLVDAFLAETPYRDRIHLVPYIEQEDLAPLYTTCFALVFPLLNDGFGLPALEAMACGAPTILSETAFPDIQHDEAILVNPLNEEAIAEAMHTMYATPELREKLIEKGFETIKRYTWEKTQRTTLNIYRTLLGRETRS